MQHHLFEATAEIILKPSVIDGISGTLGLGTCLSALALGASRIFGTGRNADLLDEVRAIAPDRIHVFAAGSGDLRNWTREHNNGEGVDAVIDALGPGAPAESFLDAISTLRRGGVAVDIGGMMERPALDMFSLMCQQISVLGSLWFSTAEAQEMADLAGSGVLDLSVLEHHSFPLEKINEALNDLPQGTVASPTSSVSPELSGPCSLGRRASHIGRTTAQA